MTPEEYASFREKLDSYAALQRLIKECNMIYHFELKVSILRFMGVLAPQSTIGEAMEMAKGIPYSQFEDMAHWYENVLDEWRDSGTSNEQTFEQWAGLEKGALC